MKRFGAIVGVLVILSGFLIAQQSLTGKWQGLTPNRDAIVLDLAAKGDDVKGTMTVGDAAGLAVLGLAFLAYAVVALSSGTP